MEPNTCASSTGWDMTANADSCLCASVVEPVKQRYDAAHRVRDATHLRHPVTVALAGVSAGSDPAGIVVAQ